MKTQRLQNRLREYRLQKGLSQYEIAKIIGVPRTTYANWEQGKCHPALPIALKLCKILNVSLEQLFNLD